ncbi:MULTISPECIES: hypothetical protein [Paenibacillus]|uniref:hypothetical protein n=1 Tax=Paenibacillus TaxID=44249 RepID=UPI00096D7F0A|nr:hypothetical protein [Paenibacillus odorifer]OME51050.1 hypothetical protein BSK61_20870 [Paenibacillus odorifer]
MKYFCVYDGNNTVSAIYHGVESMGDLSGLVFDELPSPEQNGLDPILKINLDDNTLYYEYVVRPPVLIDKLLSENTLLKAQVRAQSERSDFIEDVISELAAQLYK